MMPGDAKGPEAVRSQCLQGTVLPWSYVTCRLLLCRFLLCTTQIIVCELCIIWLLQQV